MQGGLKKLMFTPQIPPFIPDVISKRQHLRTKVCKGISTKTRQPHHFAYFRPGATLWYYFQNMSSKNIFLFFLWKNVLIFFQVPLSFSCNYVVIKFINLILTSFHQTENCEKILFLKFLCIKNPIVFAPIFFVCLVYYHQKYSKTLKNILTKRRRVPSITRSFFDLWKN